MQNLYVYTDSPALVSLFVYDNNTFIVHSFKEHNADVKIILDQKFSKLTELFSGRELDGYKEKDDMIFKTNIGPHQYQIFKAE